MCPTAGSSPWLTEDVEAERQCSDVAWLLVTIWQVLVAVVLSGSQLTWSSRSRMLEFHLTVEAIAIFLSRPPGNRKSENDRSKK